MNTTQLKAYCAAYPFTSTVLSPAPANLLSYKVGEKTFAYFKTSAPEQWRFSIKTSATMFEELCRQPNIQPARYRHRFHWITIVDAHLISDDNLYEWINWSYDEVLSTLPRKLQQKILGEACR